MKRVEVYDFLRQKLGYEYHTAEIIDINEARKIYLIVKKLHDTFFSGVEV